MVNPTKGEKVKQELRAPKKPKRSAKSRMKISDTEEVETGDNEANLASKGPSKTLSSKGALSFEFDKFSDENSARARCRARRLHPGMTWYKIIYV